MNASEAHPMLDAASRMIDLRGLPFHYRDWGGPDGARPLVLLHGLASNARFWDLTAPHLLRDGFRVFALDQRGHGASAKPNDGYDFPTVAADVATFIQDLGLERPLVVGHSWGGNVAVQVVADYPALANGIVCIDGGFIEPSSRPGATLESTLETLAPPDFAKLRLAWDVMVERSQSWGAWSRWGDARLDFLRANFHVTEEGIVMPNLTRQRHLMIVRAFWDQRVSELFPRIALPVLWLPARQQEDIADSAGWRAEKEAALVRAERLLPNTKVVWMEDSIHDVPIQRPKEVADAVLDAVRSGFFA